MRHGRHGMSVAELPADVLDLITRHLDSMTQVEVLLLLHRTKGRSWQAVAVAQEMRTVPAAAETQLASLVKVGLAATDPSAPGTYRYEAATPALERAVENLRVIYASRPVSLVTALYSRPARAVQSFADAFRVRRTGER